MFQGVLTCTNLNNNKKPFSLRHYKSGEKNPGYSLSFSSMLSVENKRLVTELTNKKRYVSYK